MFVFFIKFVITMVLSALLAPRPQVQNAKPSKLSDFDFPTAMDRPIQKIYGTVRVRSANMGWYGNLRTIPIRETQGSGGLFGKKVTQTVGYKYIIDGQFMLAFGEIDELLQIIIGEKIVWNGSHKEGSISFNKPSLFGEEKREGGVSANIDFYCGSQTQTANSFMNNQVGQIPAYKGLSYAVFRNFYVGNTAQLKPLHFIVKCLPKSTDGSTTYVDINGDANPAYIIYDILKDHRAFMGLPDDFIDLASIESAAQKLHAEGIGLSFLIDSPRSVEDFINEIERHINGKLVEDTSTGKYRLKLIRDDYIIDDLPRLTVKNTKEIRDYSRGSITKKQSGYKVGYNDRTSGYNKKFASVENLGVRHAKLIDEVTTADYMGITNAALAQQIAKRELRVMSLNMASCTAIVNRQFWNANIGDAVVLEWPALDVQSVVFRVVDVNLGKLEKGEIALKLVQDIFALPSNQYIDDGVGPSDLNQLPQPSPNVLVLEAPNFVTQQYNENAALILAGSPSLDEMGFTVLGKQSNESGYYYLGESGSCTPHGLIEAASKTDSSITVKNSPLGRLDRLEDASPQDVRNGANVCYIEDVTNATAEWVAFESVTYNSADDSYTISGLHRGLLHTVARDHSADIRIWFVSYGYMVTERNFEVGQSAYIKPLIRTFGGQIAEEDVSQTIENFNGDAERPVPPGAIHFDGNPAADGENVTNGVLIEVSPRLADPGIIVDYDEIRDVSEPDVTYEVRCYKDNAHVFSKELVEDEIQLYPADFDSITGSGNVPLELRLYAKSPAGDSLQYHAFTAYRVV